MKSLKNFIWSHGPANYTRWFNLNIYHLISIFYSWQFTLTLTFERFLQYDIKPELVTSCQSECICSFEIDKSRHFKSKIGYSKTIYKMATMGLESGWLLWGDFCSWRGSVSDGKTNLHRNAIKVSSLQPTSTARSIYGTWEQKSYFWMIEERQVGLEGLEVIRIAVDVCDA